ncbi:hypothetical protein [Thetidibacter halocola]|uniref:Uncharacterized protein n=1 Tax=Thetidibacter halocola TaxID=2827239 RepID=A0A8J8B8B5_9RHOB|nr:hypothetical protein [Thetidibacter halocola]MBS0124579.1 hypothetical protein [Thetidibacter halocola]
MADIPELDTKRRRLLTQVLAGGAIYALPMVATLSVATSAGAQEQSTSDPDTGGGGAQSGDPGNDGQPEVPGAAGNGPDRRPAPPGERGRGRGTGRNPVHDVAQSQSQKASLSPGLPFPSGRGFG